MSASSRGGQAIQGAFLAAPKMCTRCATSYATRISSRFYSTPTAAAAAAVSASSGLEASAIASAPPPPEPARRSAPPYDVRSGIIVTRPPLLTRRLHPFENAFFFYQKRLEERLNSHFITSIYFKPDTARRLDWNLKVRERRGTVAKELGTYHGKSSKAWDDELAVGDELSTQESLLNSLLKDAETRVSDDAEIIAPADVVPVERPMERETEADKKGDVRRLDRKLDRTLHLVVKGKDGWGFPADVMSEDENLHKTAQRVLDQAAGVNMNTWIVGRVPVAHVVTHPVLNADGSVQTRGCKTFFLKARIMAGQANIDGNPLGYTDFQWLTTEELEEELAPRYLRGVRNMMSIR
ncbi:mitochondrial ribosomal protein [Hirsutella rhossiliensis]|uniref:Large ribosomal subunit protein mL46 n=1 Tax=Hirsutella rhossiliensis TaxID=111463 RepID=A0A9P8N1G1_9HYPO|nr:39S mitochondrial ribosomal protein [Hirsutella rhossiliensis]KAH0962982.1 39S mitochondrial ribosomal protein [Hirsutella rhossiliensis]